MAHCFVTGIAFFFCLAWQPDAWGQLSIPTPSWSAPPIHVPAPTMGNISGGLSHAGGVASGAYQHSSSMASAASQHAVSVAKQTVQHATSLQAPQ